jgi:hypothetical protein
VPGISDANSLVAKLAEAKPKTKATTADHTKECVTKDDELFNQFPSAPDLSTVNITPPASASK